MNRRAFELTGLLDQTEIGPVNEISLAPVRELSAQIQQALDIRKVANIREPFELKRVIYDAGRKVLARGIGLADLNSHDDSRIVIVLEEIGLQKGHKVGRRRRRSFLLRAVAPSPGNQHDSYRNKEVSDAREWGVPGPSPSLDLMRRVRTSERGFQ